MLPSPVGLKSTVAALCESGGRSPTATPLSGVVTIDTVLVHSRPGAYSCIVVLAWWLVALQAGDRSARSRCGGGLMPRQTYTTVSC